MKLQVQHGRPKPGSWVLLAGCLMLLCPLVCRAGAIVRIMQSGGSRQERVCTPRGCTVVTVESRGWWSGTVIGRGKDKRLNILTCAHGYQQNLPVQVYFEPSESQRGEICCF